MNEAIIKTAVEKEIILRAHGLHKSFYNPTKIPILQGIDLAVQKGDAVAIMGRSGEGKSTLLQVLGTLEPACKGQLEIAGQEVSRYNKSYIRNKKLAFVFQSFHLLEDYTALDNVLMPARIARESVAQGSQAYKNGIDLLERVGLADRAHFHTKLLSGGEKQRVSIARALCNDPDILLADEPSGNLDKQTAASIHALLLDFVRQGKKSLIVVTHDLELAKLCDKQYLLSNGILIHKQV